MITSIVFIISDIEKRPSCRSFFHHLCLIAYLLCKISIFFCAKFHLFVVSFGHLFFELDKAFDLVKKSVDIFELAVHRRISDVGNLIDVFEPFHHQIAERGDEIS